VHQPLDRDSPTPLWAQLVDRLRDRAATGEFAGGFPSEPRLVAEYHVSRHTVREALRRLRANGVVISQRGRGSHLAPAAFTQPTGVLYSLYATIEAAGVDQHSEVLELVETTDPASAIRLGLSTDTPLIVLRRRRLAGGEPLALDTAWLPASLARPLLAADFTRTGLYAELDRRCGIRVDGGQEEITPLVLDPDTSRELGLGTQLAAFQVRRRVTASGRPVEWRVTIIRGDRYRFTTTWSPTRPYQLGLNPRAAEPA
jgi:GntR family transcriptional regulator